MRSRVAIITAALFLSAASAYAHHSFAGTYQEGGLMKIEGKVVEFNIRNPHSFILIEVKEPDGKMYRWGGEWGGVTQLSQGGVTRYTLEVGDYLIIERAGAYGFVMASNYNSKPLAAEVLLNGDQAHLIRSRQTLEDLTRGELIPAPG